MADRRALKTHKAIQAAFISLMKQKPINKISISQIAELADIGRGTFYTHYRDVFDLRDKLVEEKLQEMLRLFEASYPENNDSSYLTLFYRLVKFISDNKEFFILFTENGRNAQLMDQVKALFKEKIIEMEGTPKDDKIHNVQISYNVAGVIGVFSDWLLGELTLTDEELTAIVSNILNKF
jgi:AcrR family transcriptional regulator